MVPRFRAREQPSVVNANDSHSKRSSHRTEWATSGPTEKRPVARLASAFKGLRLTLGSSAKTIQKTCICERFSLTSGSTRWASQPIRSFQPIYGSDDRPPANPPWSSDHREQACAQTSTISGSRFRGLRNRRPRPSSFPSGRCVCGGVPFPSSRPRGRISCGDFAYALSPRRSKPFTASVPLHCPLQDAAPEWRACTAPASRRSKTSC